MNHCQCFVVEIVTVLCFEALPNRLFSSLLLLDSSALCSCPVGLTPCGANSMGAGLIGHVGYSADEHDEDPHRNKHASSTRRSVVAEKPLWERPCPDAFDGEAGPRDPQLSAGRIRARLHAVDQEALHIAQ